MEAGRRETFPVRLTCVLCCVVLCCLILSNNQWHKCLEQNGISIKSHHFFFLVRYR